jgi:H+/Cl- antiporter ClcA
MSPGPQEPLHRGPRLLASFATQIAVGVAVGLLSGLASALFLWALGWVTHVRETHAVLVYLLPVSGLVTGLLYEKLGARIKGGQNLVIDTIHDGGPTLPLRMAPMILVGSVLTHLFGGSAGREGAAVQMGASLADAFAARLGLAGALRRKILVAGVAGGFGSVFGTPVAGALFGLEFIVLGRLEYRALVPALTAAIVGDMTARRLGIEHTVYPAAPTVPLTLVLGLKWLVFAAAIALTSIVFIELLHATKKQAEKRVPRLPLRMMLGGAIVVIMWKVSGTDDFLGLGVPQIVRAFSPGGAAPWAFAAKMLFTIVTLSAGFLGGEVTPLFFVGATLGAVLARLLGIPVELGAGVGLAAVFATASNTPLALSVMAVELLGAGVLPHVLIVCAVAYALTGSRSIYQAQRLRFPKLPVDPRDGDHDGNQDGTARGGPKSFPPRDLRGR